MATQQLSVVDPELDIFLHVMCLNLSGRTEQFINEAAGSRLSATASVTLSGRVYGLLYNRQRCPADYGGLFSSNVCCGWVGPRSWSFHATDKPHQS